MKKIFSILLLALYANAHFLATLPSSDNVLDKEDSLISMDIMFIHPFEQTGMNMEEPIGVYLDNKSNKLNVKEIKKFDKKAWVLKHKINKPKVYKFFTIPKPYFEKAEEKFISHVPKVILSAYGMEEGWDKAIGLEYEIIPMVKPFSLYKGNQFVGKVLHNGKIAPNVEVEVEFYNDLGLKAPSPSHITQVVKTNDNGEFSFVMNQKGWWGFAALIENGEKEHNGKMYPIENGALMWIKAY